MSYMKKDEDADQVMMKLDRTSVFQDGTSNRDLLANNYNNIASKTALD